MTEWHMQKVRPKKSLGQHFLTDKDIAARIVDSLEVPGGASSPEDVLEVGPGTGVLTGILLKRPDVNLKMVELDPEAVEFLRGNYPGMEGRLMEADFLKMNLAAIFPGNFSIIGNFPYNISSQIFFKVLDYKDRIPEVVGMVSASMKQIQASSGTNAANSLYALPRFFSDDQGTLYHIFGTGCCGTAF